MDYILLNLYLIQTEMDQYRLTLQFYYVSLQEQLHLLIIS